jgi:hypothetical protein
MGQTLYQNPIATISHGVKNVATTMIYTHVLNRPGVHIRSPLDQPPVVENPACE